MEYTCTWKRGKRNESWSGNIFLLNKTQGYYEVRITGRGTSFHVIAGPHQYGNFICIPDHEIGSGLSGFSDLFWNTECLSRLLKKVDAVTVATGLCYLERLECPDDSVD